MSSSQQMVFGRPPTPNALPDEPADYFRPADPEPGALQNDISFHNSADGDQPAEYFRPADAVPGAPENQCLYLPLNGQTDMSDLFNFGYLATHSTDENLGLDRLLQSHDTNVDTGAEMELGYGEPQDMEDDIDARLLAALTGVNQRYGYEVQAPTRHDCPNCSCNRL